MDEAVGGGGDDLETAQRLWRALGFPDPGDSRAFTVADSDAIAVLTRLVASGVVDLDIVVKLTRAVGHTMARLADWQVATLSEYVERLEHSEQAPGSRSETFRDVIRRVEVPFEALMTHAWRRHLAAAVGRVELLDAEDAELHTTTVTVGFADLVSFSRLSNGIDEVDLAELVERFESACADVVTAGGGRVIKTLGDSVLFVAAGPREGVGIASDLVSRIGGDTALPDVHVGLATGPVVMRMGDVFGPPVNLASRLTDVARRNRVICDVETSDAIRETAGYAVRPLTERVVHGFGTVQPISVRRL